MFLLLFVSDLSCFAGWIRALRGLRRREGVLREQELLRREELVRQREEELRSTEETLKIIVDEIKMSEEGLRGEGEERMGVKVKRGEKGEGGRRRVEQSVMTWNAGTQWVCSPIEEVWN